MAAKKKAKTTTKKAVSKPKATGKKVAKKVPKKVAKKAKTFLGRIAQRSAQLVLDSGLLGEVPKAKKKRARKA